MLEYGMYDDFGVEVISWNKEKGIIFGKWKESGITKSRTFEYGELHTEHRDLIF